jgi:excinuclease ABC subunit C
MQKTKLSDSIRKLPNTPGVYLFKNKTNNVLYVGKAINLKKRVKSYFDKKIKETRITLLLKEAFKIDFEAVNSEIEALLLEARLIKAYRPKYNIILKDDKRYLYLGITKELFPRVFLLRQPEKDVELLDWFGPFPSAGSLREVFRLLRRIYPYRTCKNLARKTCLYYELKLCPGLCRYPDTKGYLKTITNIRKFMNGRIGFLLKNTEKEMEQAVQILNFEEAQRLKIKIQSIENIIGNFKRMPESESIKRQLDWLRKILAKYQGIEAIFIHRLEAYDVSNLGRKIIVGSMVVFVDGEPANSGYRRFNIRARFGGDYEGIKETLERRLNHSDWLLPQLIVIDGGKPQVSAAYEALKHHSQTEIALLGMVKGEETIVIPVIEKSRLVGWKLMKKSNKNIGLPILQHARDEAHRFAHRYYSKLNQLQTKDTLFPLLGKYKNRRPEIIKNCQTGIENINK